MRRFPILVAALLACAGAAPLPSTFTGTDCAGRAARQCTGPQGNVLSVQQDGAERRLMVDGHPVLSVQGTVGARAEWHLLGHQITGLIVPVQTGGQRIYTVVRLAGPAVQSTCLVASTPQGGPARQLASRAQDMNCLPDGATEIIPQRP
jgi:hypothetical protein